MVRISGGIYRGRKLKVPPSGVRPTKDMVRQALFSAIGGSIEGKRAADLFAGSGVIGLEAVSRGAAQVVWVESDLRTFALLTRNVKEVCGDSAPGCRCVRADVLQWLKAPVETPAFDLIVADPPYDTAGAHDWGPRLLTALASSAKLKDHGLFVLEQHVDQPVIDNDQWIIVKDGRYGETRLIYYRKAGEPITGEAAS